MKNLSILASVCCLLLHVEFAYAASPYAIIKSVKTEHNVYQGGQKGMRMMVSFYVENAFSLDGNIVAWFYHADGSRLQDRNRRFYSTTGQVSVANRFIPRFQYVDYNDVSLFMPYDELDINGRYNLKFHIGILINKQHISTSDYFHFFLDWGNRRSEILPFERKRQGQNVTISALGEFGLKRIVNVTLIDRKNRNVRYPASYKNGVWIAKDVPLFTSYDIEVKEPSIGGYECYRCYYKTQENILLTPQSTMIQFKYPLQR